MAELSTSAVALDDQRLRAQHDPSDMLSRIEALPEQCEEGRQRVAASELPAGAAEARQLVVLGIGGSAIAGDILRALAAREGRKPVTVVRGYDVPPSVDGGSLVVACSHSGNTEETLSAFDQVRERGVPAVAITTGGELAERARRHGLPVFGYAYEGEPRSALGHQLTALVRIAERAGVLDSQETSLIEAVRLMRAQRQRLTSSVPASDNEAKQLAARLFGRLPVIIGAGMLAEAAHRWKTQLNENSKCWAFYDELPELDHNAVVGFGLPRGLLDAIHVVFLRHARLAERVLRRYKATGDELSLAGVSHESVEGEGASLLAQVLTGLYLGDFVSYYLALLNGVDPSPVPPIVRLKEKLAG